MMVENLVAIQLVHINTKYPDFHKDKALVSSLLKSVEEDERFLRPANKRQNPAHVNQPMRTVAGESEKDMPKNHTIIRYNHVGVTNVVREVYVT
jgi:dynamin 1-like protein